jgi:beta-glucosidase
LVAFQKFDLQPGAADAFTQAVDPRLLATYEVADNSWHIRAGSYRVLVGQAADALPLSVDVTLPDIKWSAVHKD